MESCRRCARILNLQGFRVKTIEWDGDGPSAPVRIGIERRGIRGYECSGRRRRTWRCSHHTPSWIGSRLRCHQLPVSPGALP
jgi:hypothetical protein